MNFDAFVSFWSLEKTWSHGQSAAAAGRAGCAEMGGDYCGDVHRNGLLHSAHQRSDPRMSASAELCGGI